jgi:GlpG protein
MNVPTLDPDAARQECLMRQLVILPNPDAAQTLADHLQTLQIDTRLEKLPDGCAVWVCDEDQMTQARKELADFTSNPADPRFIAARQAAAALRRRREKDDEAEGAVRPARPHLEAAPRLAPWTYGLIAASVLVFIAHTGYLINANGGLASPEAFKILLGQSSALDVKTSPVQQALSIASFKVEQAEDHLRYEWFWLQEIQKGQVWRLVTPIFLHFGLVHLLFNMVVLLQFGALIEERRGAWRYLALILVTAVVSNIAQYYLRFTWDDGVFSVQSNPEFGGMSGVIYGLFGYLWMKSRYEPALGLSLSPRTVVLLIAWLFVCMTGVIGSVANTAHVAGLLVGVVIGAAPHLWRLMRGKPTR